MRALPPKRFKGAGTSGSELHVLRSDSCDFAIAERSICPQQLACRCLDEEATQLIDAFDPRVIRKPFLRRHTTDDDPRVDTTRTKERGDEDREIVAVSAAPEARRRWRAPVVEPSLRIRKVSQRSEGERDLKPGRNAIGETELTGQGSSGRHLIANLMGTEESSKRLRLRCKPWLEADAGHPSILASNVSLSMLTIRVRKPNIGL